MEIFPFAWRGRRQWRLWRWRWWIAVIAAILAVRAVLPTVLRKVLVAQASEALHARVDIGDVDLALLRGGVTLEDVAVRPAGSTPDEATPAPGPGTAPPPFPDHAPIIAFKRFAVELRYLPLFSRTIQLRAVEIESPRVALDRLASGDLNVTALVPSSGASPEVGATPSVEATAASQTMPPSQATRAAEEAEATAESAPAPEATASEPTPGAEVPTTAAADATATAVPDAEAGQLQWKFGIDRFALRDGRLRFRDLKVEGSEPVEVGIDEVAVEEIALSPGVYGEPARLHLRLGIDQGALEIGARLRLHDAGLALVCEVTAERLPLRRTRLYVPTVGWSDLQGELDLALTYQLDTDTAHELHGTVALRDVAITVPHLEDVAVAWKSLGVAIETVDLLGQRVALSEVALDGAKLYVRARGGAPLPVLAPPGPAGAVAEESAAQTARTPEAACAEAAGEEPPRPWDWRVASVRVTESMVRILSDQPPLDIGVDLTARDLAGAPGAVGHLALALALGAGALRVDGDVRPVPPAFGGTLQIADLSLPPLLAVSGAVPPEVLASGTFKADLAVDAGLPARRGTEAAPDVLRVSGTLGLTGAKLLPPGQGGLTVEANSVGLNIAELAVPGIIPIGQPAEAGASVRVGANLTVEEPRVTRAGEQDLSAGAQSIDLAVTDLAVPAALAGLGPGDGPLAIRAAAALDLEQPRLALGGGRDLSAETRSIRVRIADASIPAVLPGASAAAAPPARLAAELILAEPRVALAEGQQLSAGAQSIGLQVAELVIPGLVVGAPPNDTGEPLRAAATLTLAQPRAARADGKEFSVAAKAVSVPVTELLLPGALAASADTGAAPPVLVALGDVRVDAPAIRVTRTADDIVLPAASPSPGAQPSPEAQQPPGAAPPAAAAPSPPSGRPIEVAVAALRVTQGAVDFTDRAVQPVFRTRFAPIEIEARNVCFPDVAAKPLRVEVTTAEQGRITATGDVGADEGALDLVVKDLALVPFNAYATAYSPYSIGDGALSVSTKATFSGGRYDVHNALTLHQLVLTGAEGESLFEQQFGIPLSMVLALLRDVNGDISLDIPVQGDRTGGATVGVIGIVRGALLQAISGAIQSPLKLIGAVAGVGGKSGPIAPAPIAFRSGRAALSDAGAQSAERLGDFLAGRPGMAVALDTAVTLEDVRWLREQALGAEWEDESFLAGLAFLAQRSARDNIRRALTARAQDQAGELSPEDAATLDRWLDERPGPAAAQLRDLAAARLAVVESVLQEKGMDPARISRAEPTGELVEGGAVVRIEFRPVAGPS